jgi:hypothetical protein
LTTKIGWTFAATEPVLNHFSTHVPGASGVKETMRMPVAPLEMEGEVVVPSGWSSVAVTVVGSVGVPAVLVKVAVSVIAWPTRYSSAIGHLTVGSRTW